LRSKLAALDDVGARSVSRHEDVRFETGPSGVRGERSTGVTRTRNGELGGAKIISPWIPATAMSRALKNLTFAFPF